MKLSQYTVDDIEYITSLLNRTNELISEGAALTVYTSSKYLIAKIAIEYENTYTAHAAKIPDELRLTFYKNARRVLPQLFQEYKKGDFELFVAKHLSILYRNILYENLGTDY